MERKLKLEVYKKRYFVDFFPRDLSLMAGFVAETSAKNMLYIGIITVTPRWPFIRWTRCFTGGD